jgi:UDPglucose 6-dehydrogenase
MPTLGRLGKVCGRDYGLCYSPEFVAIGNVIAGMKEPDFVLIGESDRLAGEMMAQIYRSICGDGVKIVRENWIEAELAKLILNCYVTMKMSFANMIAMLCEKIPGADAARILRAIGLDHRIGRHYLTPAAAWGGPCFPRDNRALLATAHALSPQTTMPLPYASDRVNRAVTHYLAEQILSLNPNCIALLGLAYKPATYVTEESAALALAKELSGSTTVMDIVGYDPGQELAPLEPCPPPWIKVVDTLKAAIQHADVVVICTPWVEFGLLGADDFEGCTAERIHVFDLWRQLDNVPLGGKVIYRPFGRYVAMDVSCDD